MPRHTLDASAVHYQWSGDTPPRLNIDSGDVVDIETRDGFDGQLLPSAVSVRPSTSGIPDLDMTRVAPLTGPIYVRGAEPGDVLSVDVLALAPAGIGVMVVWPADYGYDFLGLAARREFPEGRLKYFDFSGPDIAARTISLGRARIPLRPMLGIMGNAPREGRFRTGPPMTTGGNLDLQLLGPGTTLHLPVQVPGALFSAGDGHAAQGDGEMCTTGVEVSMRGTLAFHVRKAVDLPEPHVETASLYAITATGSDLEEASRKAMGYWLRWLTVHHAFAIHDAYMLLSAGADLRVNQVVNKPRLGVRIELPKAVFNASLWPGDLPG